MAKKAAQEFFCAVSKVFDRVRSRDFPNITLFIYKPQTRVWFVYTGQS
jgi:hypothetical protein